MSNALRQSQRANIRESNSTGTCDARASVSHQYCMDLTPSSQQIQVELKSPSLMKVAEKVSLCKSIIKYKVEIAEKLSSKGHVDLSRRFTNHLPSDLRGDRGKNEYLCTLILILRESLILPILNNTATMESFDNQIQIPLRKLMAVTENARANAATKLANEFSKKFIKLKGADVDRKFLENGKVPTDEAKSKCLGCGHHEAVDEPTSNEIALSRNLINLKNHAAQVLKDQADWDNGLVVRNSHGKEMTRGRQRPFKSDIVRQDCHCNQSGCNSKIGLVPISDCPKRCIDVTTGHRYGFDTSGNCQCPICGCDCQLSWDVSCITLSIFFTIYFL